MLEGAALPWEMSDMAENEELQGRQLYDALMQLKPKRLAETEWAAEAGLNRGFFTNLKSKDIRPRSDTLRKLLRHIGRNEGELYALGETAGVETVADQPPIRSASAADGAVEVKQLDLSYAMGPGTSPDDYPDSLPVLFDPNFIRTLTRAPVDRLFVARGDGDSMFPTLINDDQVMVDMTQTTLNMQDRIWALSVHGASMIKRLRSIGRGKVRVLSDNPTVPDQEVEIDDLHIVGRVIWVGRRV